MSTEAADVVLPFAGSNVSSRGEEASPGGEQSDVSSVSSDASVTKFTHGSICALSITIVIGGQYYQWNTWLKYGFGMWAVAQLLMAAAYLVYASSIAEIVSAFPFSGGGYGLARVTQGYYVGFLVGCCECLEYIAYTSMSFLYFSDRVIDLLGISHHYSLLFCLLCYVVGCFITVYNGRWLLMTNYVLGFISLLVLLMFCFGSLQFTNFVENASLHKHHDVASFGNWFQGGMPAFLTVLPDATAAYGGIEALSLLPSLTNSPRKSIPRGLLAGIAVLFVTNMLIMFVVASLPGGIRETSEALYPMHIGFELMFKCQQWVTVLLMLPAQYAMAFGFILPYSKLLQAFGTTNLLPKWMQMNDCTTHTNGTIVGSLIGFAICAIAKYYPSENLAHICILAGFLTYLSQLHAYWMLKTRYSTSQREFTSPFGVSGVVFSSIVFLLGMVGTIGYSAIETPIFMVIFLSVLSAYYYIFAAKTQTIAKEEQAVLFQLHVAKQNRRRHKKPSQKKPHRTQLKAVVVAAVNEGLKKEERVVYSDVLLSVGDQESGVIELFESKKEEEEEGESVGIGRETVLSASGVPSQREPQPQETTEGLKGSLDSVDIV